MKIVFALPNIDVGGGSRVVFDYLSALYRMGHKVLIVHKYTVEQHLSDIRAVTEARARRGIAPTNFPDNQFEIKEILSLSAQHRKWAWMALGASNLKTARKHAWRAFAANPFDPANLRLIACVLRGC